ncbi:hypothetical protein AAL_02063 [Moelleriella libera RCEF 2490]|uniref:Uncharacterized protein n=1 Tax=Moelleriella libera RCEF 2490 TaxID=1081109 RepID=A0A168F5A9_9HYPO|nr:hypothetical protein AAL_02063 [Moelleriella libera RCEF 2490]
MSALQTYYNTAPYQYVDSRKGAKSGPTRVSVLKPATVPCHIITRTRSGSQDRSTPTPATTPRYITEQQEGRRTRLEHVSASKPAAAPHHGPMWTMPGSQYDPSAPRATSLQQTRPARQDRQQHRPHRVLQIPRPAMPNRAGRRRTCRWRFGGAADDGTFQARAAGSPGGLNRANQQNHTAVSTDFPWEPSRCMYRYYPGASHAARPLDLEDPAVHAARDGPARVCGRQQANDCETRVPRG